MQLPENTQKGGILEDSKATIPFYLPKRPNYTAIVSRETLGDAPKYNNSSKKCSGQNEFYTYTLQKLEKTMNVSRET